MKLALNSSLNNIGEISNEASHSIEHSKMIASRTTAMSNEGYGYAHKASLTNADSRINAKAAVYAFAKRAFDLIAVSIALPLLLPVFAVIAVIISLDSRGPVFYYQNRTGKDGKSFRFYKFRSMVTNADAVKVTLATINEATGPIFKMRNDPRVTKVGRILRKYSIDELPQLINVFCGEMSIIGPRPLPVQEAEQCTERQFTRHSIKPGLLCFREVNGRSNLSFEEWMESDLDYLEKRGFRTDFSILVRAIPAVLNADGAY